MHVSIIGRGAWGKSIASLLEENQHEVHFLTRDNIHLSDHDIVVLALPTNAIREALSAARDIKNLTIINCSKGIEIATHKFPFEIIQEITHSSTNYLSLLGPSFAHEVQEKMPTLVNLGPDTNDSQRIKQLFQTSYLRIHVVDGIPSLELAGAMKNIYAIACGLAEGMGFGLNTRIKLIITAIDEFYTLAKGLGYTIDERAVGGVIGDFMLTGSSTASRNFQFGKLLITHTADESLQIVGATVEGYASFASLSYLFKKGNVRLPLAEFVIQSIHGTKETDIKKHFLAFAEKI